MNKNIVISNSKGGAGKSTVSAFLAMISSNSGLKTIMIDSGWQRHSTKVFLHDEQISKNLLDGLKNKKILKECVYTINEKLDIIPATINMNNFSDEFSNITGDKKNLIFKTVLDPTLSNYDICVFDTESSLGALTRNALVLADIIIIPIRDGDCIVEAEKLLQTIDDMQQLYPNHMFVSKIFIFPVIKPFLSRDYNQILNEAKRTLKHDFLMPVKYHSALYTSNSKKAFNREGKAYKDYEKSLQGAWII